MDTNRPRSLRISGISAAGLLVIFYANAEDFRFFQGGYSEGAFVSGSFSGVDLNSDGQLIYALDETPNEVTAFSMSFSGNSLVAPFSLEFIDLTTLVYHLGTPGIGDGLNDGGWQFEGIEAIGQHFFYETGLGPLSTEGGRVSWAPDFGPGGVDSTRNVAQVAQVPDAGATLTLLGLSCGIFLTGRWARKSLRSLFPNSPK